MLVNLLSITNGQNVPEPCLSVCLLVRPSVCLCDCTFPNSKLAVQLGSVGDKKPHRNSTVSVGLKVITDKIS